MLPSTSPAVRARDCFSATLALALAAGLGAVAFAQPSPRASFLAQQCKGAELFSSVPVSEGLASITLGDLLFVTIRVPPAASVNVPAQWLESPDIAVKLVDEPVSPERWQRTLALSFRQPGTHDVQLAPLSFRDATGRHIVSWESFKVAVSPTLQGASLKNLRGGPDIEHVPSPPPAAPVWPWLLAACVAALILLGVRRRRVPHLFRPHSPEVLARRELARLTSLDLPARNQGEEFHTLLANIVRRFLERQYALRARRMTTAEFLQAMNDDPRLTPDQKAFLETFLARCDLAKFAPLPASAQDCTDLLQQTEKFIDHHDSSRAR